MKKKKPDPDRKQRLDPLSFLHQPHDKYVRFVLQVREIALELIQFCLSPDTFETLDLESLTVSEDTFVDVHLQPHFADVCYTGTTKTEKPFRVCIIFEHKSVKSNEPVIAQLFRYISNVWSSDLKQDRPLSLSIPVLIYHGKSPIRKETPESIFSGAPPELLKYIPHFDYEILDIKRISDEVIENLQFLRIRNIILALKHSRDPVYMGKFWKKIIIFAPEVQEKMAQMEVIKATILYLYKVSPTFNEKINDMDNALSAAEQEVIKPYLFELYEQGIEKGIEKGKMDTLRLMIHNFLKKNPDWTDQQMADLFEIDITLVAKLRK